MSEQPYRTSTMTPEQSRQWTDWATRIAKDAAASAVKAHRKDVVGFAEDVGREVRLLRDRVKALEGEVVQLRERIASIAGEMRGRAHSGEIDLPALPGEARAYRDRQN